MNRRSLIGIGALAVIGLLAWKILHQEQQAAAPPVVTPQEVIPPGIVVTESSPVVPPPSSSVSAPGDRMLGDYGNASLPAANDLVILGRAISGFLTIGKRAVKHPLSANEEWSAALRGMRPGTEPWITEGPPVFDPQHRLIDRWGTPLFFHALGGKQWEIRSAGPDRKLWTDDDMTEKFTG